MATIFTDAKARQRYKLRHVLVDQCRRPSLNASAKGGGAVSALQSMVLDGAECAGKDPSCPVATNPRTAISKNVRLNTLRKGTRSVGFRKKRRSGGLGLRKIKCPEADARVVQAAAKQRIDRRLERAVRKVAAAPDRAHPRLDRLRQGRVREHALVRELSFHPAIDKASCKSVQYCSILPTQD
jgi:hypothetical protein